MNILDLELIKKKKIKNKKKVPIPILKLVIAVNGEMQFEVIGEKEVPIVWLEKE
ncbi:hypothetical protein [Bacillus toyonensis]|uniref:hypothetical protein n=1 Tax=Bacillus toyonensis TaxID=155322 RepID=UPI000B43DD1D|nr:hypothetical protein [Bacillus toyonensis]MED3202249.1 hypothetical protein [Bacillus toyonensis]OTX08904.1 hypothetical protein BK712_07885 [Bacillus thuringiensis serovar seoulensis]